MLSLRLVNDHQLTYPTNLMGIVLYWGETLNNYPDESALQLLQGDGAEAWHPSARPATSAVS